MRNDGSMHVDSIYARWQHAQYSMHNVVCTMVVSQATTIIEILLGAVSYVSLPNFMLIITFGMM